MTEEFLNFLEGNFPEEPIKLMDETPFECEPEKTLCFSGHRPESLPNVQGLEKLIKSYIVSEIKKAVEEGFNTFIMGGSRGIDLWAGMAVLLQRHESPGIRLVAALPYHTASSRFTEHERFDYGYVLESCDEVLYASDSYSKDCMKRRNLFMIEHSSRIIAFVKNSRSGTGQTIRLAEKAGLDTHIYNLDDYVTEKSFLNF
jgi:uncharacterized phage-like protein YoqJ